MCASTRVPCEETDQHCVDERTTCGVTLYAANCREGNEAEKLHSRRRSNNNMLRSSSS